MDLIATLTRFLENYLLEMLIVVVGWILASELRSGRVAARFGRVFTRWDNPFRYWFWIFFQAFAFAGLIAAWYLGFDFDF